MTRTPTDDSTLFTAPYRGLRVVVTGGGSASAAPPQPGSWNSARRSR